MTDFSIRQDDRLPAIVATLLDSDLEPVDLTTATAVTFRLRRLDSSTLSIDAAGIVDSPATSGRVRYEWADGDTAEAGAYIGEWQVAFPGGTQTFPQPGLITVVVSHSLTDLPTISAADLASIRQSIGAAPPSDGELAVMLAERGTVANVVLAVQEERFAALLAKPAKYTIEGDSSFDYSANLAAMQKELGGRRRTASGLATGQLVADWPR